MSCCKRIYLASPYTSKEPGVQEQRAREVARVAGALIENGHNVFCPIAMSHFISDHSVMPASGVKAHDMWMRNDLAFLETCHELYVLMLDGWIESTGVKEEIEFARVNGLSIHYLNKEGHIVSTEEPFYTGGA